MGGWLLPAMLIGTALWARSKRSSGKVRWVQKTEQEVKQMPIGLVLEQQMESGDALPAPKEGHRWKAIQMYVATSPLTAPEEIVIHVLEPIFGANLSAFLTTQLVQSPTGLGSSYLTTDDVTVSPKLSGFLSVQRLQRAPHLGADLIF